MRRRSGDRRRRRLAFVAAEKPNRQKTVVCLRSDFPEQDHGCSVLRTQISGPNKIVISVSDGKDTTSVTILWTVLPNAAPEVVNPGPQTTKQNDEVSLQIDASDPDDDRIEYEAFNLPKG